MYAGNNVRNIRDYRRRDGWRGGTWLGQVVVMGHGRWSWPHSTKRLVPGRERQTGDGGVELMR